MDQYTFVIIATTVGFFALAALLLVPVYRFLKREEEASKQWERSSPGPPESAKTTNGASDAKAE
jgi:hypothetical protein